MRWIKEGYTLFGRYKILERLEGGGQCLSFKAQDLVAKNSAPWEKILFVKQYIDLVATPSEFKRIAEHFNKIYSRLKKIQNLVCLPIDLEICKYHEAIVSVFPFIINKRLSERIIEGIDHNTKVRIAFAIINITRKIHEQEIAHLDIKPDNIIVYNSLGDGKLYVQMIDFDGSKVDGTSLRPNVIKTILYSSYEHFSENANHNTSIKSDIFSLGIVLLELLIGKYPFSSSIPYLQSAAEKKFTFDSTQIHREIIEILIKCLDLDPNKRPSAGKLLSIFNKHYLNNLKAFTDSNKWNSAKNNFYISLVNMFGSFKRTYYEDIIITSQDLKGSGVDMISGELFALIFKDHNCYIRPMNMNVNIRIDDDTLFLNRSYRLLYQQHIYINDEHFGLQVSYYHDT